MRKRATQSFISLLFVAVSGIYISCSSDASTEPVNKPPTCSILLPEGKTTCQFHDNETIKISVNAEDSDGRIKIVLFFIDGEFIHSDQTSPYEYIWHVDRSDYGTHTIKVEAIDDDNLSHSALQSLTLEYLYRQPETINDGWETSTLSEQNVDWSVEGYQTGTVINLVADYVIPAVVH